MGLTVQSHTGKERLIYNREGGWHCIRSKVIPNTGYIVFKDRDVKYGGSVRERRRDMLSGRDTWSFRLGLKNTM